MYANHVFIQRNYSFQVFEVHNLGLSILDRYLTRTPDPEYWSGVIFAPTD